MKIILRIMFGLASAGYASDIRFIIDPAQELRPLESFWQDSGFMRVMDLEKPAMQGSFGRIAVGEGGRLRLELATAKGSASHRAG